MRCPLIRRNSRLNAQTLLLRCGCGHKAAADRRYCNVRGSCIGGFRKQGYGTAVLLNDIIFVIHILLPWRWKNRLPLFWMPEGGSRFPGRLYSGMGPFPKAGCLQACIAGSPCPVQLRRAKTAQSLHKNRSGPFLPVRAEPIAFPARASGRPVGFPSKTCCVWRRYAHII